MKWHPDKNPGFIGHIGSTEFTGYAMVIIVLFRFITRILVTLFSYTFSGIEYSLLISFFWIKYFKSLYNKSFYRCFKN
jgi:hypothetical protein